PVPAAPGAHALNDQPHADTEDKETGDQPTECMCPTVVAADLYRLHSTATRTPRLGAGELLFLAGDALHPLRSLHATTHCWERSRSLFGSSCPKLREGRSSHLFTPQPRRSTAPCLDQVLSRCARVGWSRAPGTESREIRRMERLDQFGRGLAKEVVLWEKAD